MRTVTKKDVAKRTAIELQKKEPDLNVKIYTAEKFVDAVFTVLRELLCEADPEVRIEIRDFGVFEVKPRAARKARNPRTGEQVDVPRKHVVTFKPGKYMEAKVRDLDEAEERRILEAERDGKPTNSASQNDIKPTDSPSGRWDTD